jgi:glyoxylase-like metal-dependent hydrolase (beta-lactamase superfamily II)
VTAPAPPPPPPPASDDPWLAERPPDRPEDLALEEVAPEVFRIPLPLPFEVGPVNAVLLRGEEPALIDCGPRTDEAWAALAAGLERLGTPPARLRHIFCTHAHVDHYGALGRLAALAPGARLYAHARDAAGIFEHGAYMEAKAALVLDRARWWGYPEAAIEPARRGYLSFRRYGEDAVPRSGALLLEGSEGALSLGARRARWLHVPGHSEGHIVLLLETEAGGVLIAGDHILERITPNPTVYLEPWEGRWTGLAHYHESLAHVRDLPAALVLPGHGPSFAGLAARVDAILRAGRRRGEEIEAIVSTSRPLTVLEIALELWRDLPVHQHFLACREVEGHLEIIARRTGRLLGRGYGGPGGRPPGSAPERFELYAR